MEVNNYEDANYDNNDSSQQGRKQERKKQQWRRMKLGGRIGEDKEENVGNVEKGDIRNRCQGKQREKEIIILLILLKLVEHFSKYYIAL